MTYDEPDPFVPIWEGQTFEAEHLRLLLETAHIPVEFGDALLPGHARVQVPRSYLEEANDVIKGTNARWPELTQATATGFDVKPSLRLALTVMAAVLLVLLVLLVL